MNKIVVILAVLVILYALFRIFMNMTKLIVRVGIVVLILFVLGFGVVNVADLIPNGQAAEKVSDLVEKIPEEKLPGNKLVSELIPGQKEVEVVSLNETMGNLTVENQSLEEAAIEQNLTEVGQ